MDRFRFPCLTISSYFTLVFVLIAFSVHMQPVPLGCTYSALLACIEDNGYSDCRLRNSSIVVICRLRRFFNWHVKYMQIAELCSV